jgi:threonine/homoserine/homoserine lactone efflux protein
VNELVGLAAFAFVGSVSPGPNNAVLWASGIRFGFARTVPYVIGTALGIGALVVAVAAGLDVLLRAVPGIQTALKVVGSAYLLYIAYLVLEGGGVGPATVAAPPSLWQGVGFQWVNPKAWLFAIAAVGTFVPPDLHRALGIALVTVTIVGVVIVSASIWAVGGSALGRFTQDERRRRVVGWVLASLLVASVALIWI